MWPLPRWSGAPALVPASPMTQRPSHSPALGRPPAVHLRRTHRAGQGRRCHRDVRRGCPQAALLCEKAACQYLQLAGCSSPQLALEGAAAAAASFVSAAARGARGPRFADCAAACPAAAAMAKPIRRAIDTTFLSPFTRSVSSSYSLVAAKTGHSTGVHCGLDGRAKNDAMPRQR